MDCDTCKHMLVERDVHGHTLHQCGKAKCPIVLRDEVLEEAAKKSEGEGFDCCGLCAKSIRSMKSGG